MIESVQGGDHGSHRGLGQARAKVRAERFEEMVREFGPPHARIAATIHTIVWVMINISQYRQGIIVHIYYIPCLSIFHGKTGNDHVQAIGQCGAPCVLGMVRFVFVSNPIFDGRSYRQF